jgi:uncharacterized protein (DUF4415 family)
MKKPNPEMVDDENPEWTEEDFRRARPAAEVLPEALHAKLGIRRRGPQKAPTKIPTQVRFDPAVIEHFKAGGPGWQTRINDALKKAIEAGIA